MIVEPFAIETVQENLNSLGRMFYSASTMICTPASKAQEVGFAPGAQAGEKRIRDVVMAGGFRRFRRASQTAFNLIYEARAPGANIGLPSAAKTNSCSGGSV